MKLIDFLRIRFNACYFIRSNSKWWTFSLNKKLSFCVFFNPLSISRSYVWEDRGQALPPPYLGPVLFLLITVIWANSIHIQVPTQGAWSTICQLCAKSPMCKPTIKGGTGSVFPVNDSGSLNLKSLNFYHFPVTLKHTFSDVPLTRKKHCPLDYETMP